MPSQEFRSALLRHHRFWQNMFTRMLKGASAWVSRRAPVYAASRRAQLALGTPRGRTAGAARQTSVLPTHCRRGCVIFVCTL